MSLRSDVNGLNTELRDAKRTIEELRAALLKMQQGQSTNDANAALIASLRAEIEDLKRRLAAAGNQTVDTSRYDSEIENLRRLLAEARAASHSSNCIVATGDADGAGNYTRDKHRIHHINFGGDMRFA